ncbi:hypothetical protein PENANT_c020G10286 [Penicillium antarcticum]|uniref:BZIP domain-containing protein n=1 Tax=Penicillium antarcticum TaxID=416450 RepID=A0A1V6Q0J1_9EURO|nr:uncharacterized protein N7508_004351 [Penicillium antarcticum]KAJ5308972.1 hypothetical protein N7508_004351 [Penicillium antarcticum]OQD82753.1 hypothetical protein PENANT_c020G10286 [Penicillium antarcticum]
MRSARNSAVGPDRAKHLERNRIAANKCRERKKREHKQIERRLSDETEKKELLLAQLNCLKEEVWDLKNIIFQHAECKDHQINLQLARMTQTVLENQPMQECSMSPTFSNGSYSDESVTVDEVNHNNLIDPRAYPGGDWTVLPKVADDLVPYDANTTNDSIFENFIDAENLCT